LVASNWTAGAGLAPLGGLGLVNQITPDQGLNCFNTQYPARIAR
jgi:hypothetical protein